MVLGEAVTKLWRLYISLTMFQESSLDPCSTLEHQTWSNDQSQHDLLYGGVSLSISLNLKQAPVPYATPKWPIGSSYVVTVGQKVVTGIFLGATNPQQFSNRAVLIGLFHDTRYLCTPLRTDRKKAKSRGFSGGDKCKTMAHGRNRDWVCLFYTKGNEDLFILKTIMSKYGRRWALLRLRMQ